MNKLFTFLIVLFLAGLTSCKEENTVNSSNTILQNDQPIIQSTHVSFVLYDELPQSITVPIITKIDQNFERILSDMQLTSLPIIKIEIWNDETHFQNDMMRDIGTNYWGATGYVYSSTNVRILNRGSAAQTVLHEFAHAVSLNVNRQFGNNPRWFWEAVAIYESGEFNDPKNISYLAAGNFPTIAELTADFNTGARKIYEVGYLLSEYIIETWGKESYTQMIKNNANIPLVLSISTAQFENGWKEFVMKKYFNF